MQMLLVEDNPSDVRLTKEALREAGIPCDVTPLDDGDHALRYLRRQDEFRDAPSPDVVVLDLNLPRVTGPEVLQAMRAEPNLASLPVVVLTTSRHHEHIMSGHDASISRYMVKPTDLDDFLRVVHDIHDFWREVELAS